MSIADRISSMASNLSSAYGRIAYLGVDTSSIDKNLQNLSNVLDTVYKEYPKVSDEGISPNIEGSRVGRLNTTLKASDTTQFSTTGANKFSFNTNKRRVSSSATFKENQDNSLIFETTTGTWSNMAYVYENTSKNTDYYLKLIAKSSINISSRVTVYGTNVLEFASADLTSLSQEPFDLTANTPLDVSTSFNSGSYDYLVFRFWGNASSTTLSEKATMTFSNVMLSLTDDTYEPYTGGIPSPSPDFPQSIHTIKGNNTVEVCGKNFANLALLYGNPTYYTISSDNEVTVIAADDRGFSNNLNGVTWGLYLKAGTYTMSFNPNSHGTLQVYGKNTGAIIQNVALTNGYATFTMTTEDIVGIKFTGLSSYLPYNAGHIQIEQGSTATTYEPYTGTTYPINLPVQNLFDKDNANIYNGYISSVTPHVLVSSVNSKTLYISVQPNTAYTISKTSSTYFRTGFTSGLPSTDVEVFEYNSLTPMQKTITSNSTAKYLVCTFWTNSDTLTEQQIRDSIQIEPGNKANRYTPYGVAPIELCKIGDYQDILFKAISGDTIYDSLTSEQKEGLVSGGWYKYGDFGKLVLNGSETSDDIGAWRKSTNTTAMDRFILNLQPAWQIYATGYTTSLCNYFISGTNAIGRWRNNNGEQLVFNFSEYGTTTLEQWKTWVSTHNLQLYQPLITPVITQITDVTLISQLEALYSAMSKNGQTNILQTNADIPFTIFASALKGE